MIASNTYECDFWRKEELVIGIDEAGRGPIAGPLVVAGVVFPPYFSYDGIYDSKKISEKKRNELFEVIKKEALFYVINVVDCKVVDDKNIYQATKEAMIECTKFYFTNGVLSDAMPFSVDNKEVIPIIKGDQKSISIAAASILAKVTRDHIMELYDEIYPQYLFKQHKGYPTKKHQELVFKHGITPIHRKTYEPIKSYITQNLFDL